VNCQPHDVPILVAARLLKLLGNPLPNGVKFFAACEIMESAKDRIWLVKATNALNQHWQKKNERRKIQQMDSRGNSRLAVARATSS